MLSLYIITKATGWCRWDGEGFPGAENHSQWWNTVLQYVKNKKLYNLPSSFPLCTHANYSRYQQPLLWQLF